MVRRDGELEIDVSDKASSPWGFYSVKDAAERGWRELCSGESVRFWFDFAFAFTFGSTLSAFSRRWDEHVKSVDYRSSASHRVVNLDKVLNQLDAFGMDH